MTGAFLFSCKKNDTGVLFYGTRYRLFHIRDRYAAVLPPAVCA